MEDYKRTFVSISKFPIIVTPWPDLMGSTIFLLVLIEIKKNEFAAKNACRRAENDTLRKGAGWDWSGFMCRRVAGAGDDLKSIRWESIRWLKSVICKCWRGYDTLEIGLRPVCKARSSRDDSRRARSFNRMKISSVIILRLQCLQIEADGVWKNGESSFAACGEDLAGLEEISQASWTAIWVPRVWDGTQRRMIQASCGAVKDTRWEMDWNGLDWIFHMVLLELQ